MNPRGGQPHPSAPRIPEGLGGPRGHRRSQKLIGVNRRRGHEPQGGQPHPSAPRTPHLWPSRLKREGKRGETPQSEKQEKRKRPPREGGRLPLDPRGRGRWGPGGTWGAQDPLMPIDRFAYRKRAPSRGRTVGVMLRLTPIEDPGRREEAGKTPPDAHRRPQKGGKER